MLRPYQQEAHDAVIDWVKISREPCVVDAATGAGKSYLIAALAKTIHRLSGGKKILCLAPSKELIEQNSEKYKLTGNSFSMFSASVGQKSLRHPVVFGTPGTVKNRISRFGSEFAMVIIDEAHSTTPTVRLIIDAMRGANPNLRVVGLSATCFRMLTGYVFGQWPDGRPVPAEMAVGPYFAKCVYSIKARPLIEQGYLSPITVGKLNAEAYHTLDMQLNSRGQFNATDIDRAFHGQGRKTARIMADVVAQSRNRQGVMIFAATVRHAQECLDSLPPELSMIVTAETSKVEREKILARFKKRQIKYLVNVSVLTTGFDAEHVDVIALLRATESPGLLQQIIGRGMRRSDGKDDCLFLDYAENTERHFPDGDIFAPEIRTMKMKGTELVTVKCPLCGVDNLFRPRPNDEGFSCSADGYFCDLDGAPVSTPYGPMPSHYGRRCQSKVLVQGDMVQCGHRWTGKECPHCEAENDIAARYCIECKGEIVDPNEKLRLDFKALKKDPTRKQTDEVMGWDVVHAVSRSGKPTFRVNVVTPHRSFTVWIMQQPTFSTAMRDLEAFNSLAGEVPKTVTYQKDVETGFYRILAYNRAADMEPAE